MIVLTLLFLGASRLFAFSGTFHLSADLLYMQVSVDQPEFVIKNTESGLTQPRGDRVVNDQGHHYGYRAEGAYRFCDSATELVLKWTQFPDFSEQHERSADTLGFGLYPLFNHPEDPLIDELGTATIDDKFSIRLLDFFLRQQIVCGSRFSFSLQGGLQYGYLKLREEVHYPNASSTRIISAFARTKGLGPAIGLDTSYCLFSNFNLVGNFSNGWLIADIDKNFKDIDVAGATTTVVADVENDKYWRLIPTFDLRFGLNYGHKIFCTKLDLELGYEVIIARKGIENIYFVDTNNPGSSFNKERTLTMQGPYVHLGISF